MKDVKEYLSGKLKSYKGVFSKKGGYLDYTEAHAFMYGVNKSLKYVRPISLAKNLNAGRMDFEQWENSEGQYSDAGMVAGYATKVGLTAALAPQYLPGL